MGKLLLETAIQAAHSSGSLKSITRRGKPLMWELQLSHFNKATQPCPAQPSFHPGLKHLSQTTHPTPPSQTQQTPRPERWVGTLGALQPKSPSRKLAFYCGSEGYKQAGLAGVIPEMLASLALKAPWRQRISKPLTP